MRGFGLSDMGQEVLKKFDRYFLLDCLAQGGMAEIFRARPAKVDAASRLLVIKRILSGHGKSHDFIQMFRSETRVMMGFSHPNIVQLYDFGQVKDQPFIAMEYVDGKNLRQILTQLGKQKETLKVEECAYIIEQAALGLYYAHNFKDKITGEHLGVVHRDVSPQNVLISYDGGVKVIDFGIAKAKTNSEATRVGIIKGKPSYLSPEQINAKELDGRSDVFSLGAVLWEILTGKKLFAAKSGENEFAVLKLIESCETYVKPPSQVNDQVPDELDYIVLKALAKDSEKRYQSAEEMRLALRKYLTEKHPDFQPVVLAERVKDLFANAIVDDRKKLQALTAKAEQLLQEDEKRVDLTDPFKKVHTKTDLPRKDVKKDSSVERSLSGSISHARSGSNDRDLSFDDDDSKVQVDSTRRGTASQPFHVPPPVPPLRRKKSDESSRAQAEGPDREKTLTRALPNPQVPRNAKFDRSRVSRPQRGRGARRARTSTLAVVAGIAALVIVFLEPEGIFDLGKSDKSGEANRTPSQEVPAAREANKTPSSSQIRLILRIPPGFYPAQISLNGKTVPEQSPDVLVSLDAPLRLQVSRRGFKSFDREFTLSSSRLKGKRQWVMEVPLEPLRFGYLSVRSTPSADVTIRKIDEAQPSQPLKMRTPIIEGRFPAGKYQVELKNEVLGMEKTLVTDIEEGRTVKLDERLDVKP